MIIDAHCDIWWDVAHRRGRGERNVLERVHLPAMRAGTVEGAVFALWTEAERGNDYVTPTARMLSARREELLTCESVQAVYSVQDLEQARAAEKFWIVTAAEGMDAIGSNPAGIDWYYDHGVRWGMLTWNGENGLAAGARCPHGGGLTSAGRQAVRRKEELGMVVDVSHLNDDGFADVVRQARGPVVASHSNCRKLCDVPRNLTDDQLRALRDCGGVIGVNAYHGFVHKEREKQTVETLAHHAAHIIDVCGIDHVGFGFDFCAYLGPGNDPIPDMTGPERIGCMVERLRDMGLRTDEMEKICRGNWLRVLETVLQK